MDTFLAGARVIVSLAVVLGLLWMLQRRLTRGSRKSAAGHPVTIVTKQAISPKASVVIIDVEGTRLLLGVTEHAVSVLQTGDAPEPVIEVAPATAPASGARAFAESLSKVTAAKISTVKPVARVTKAAVSASTSSGTVKGSATATKRASTGSATATTTKAPDLAPVAAFSGQGPLAGSIISPATWKQLGASLRRSR
ncbi:FliO/MopB family protein [Parafrigoribacterium soli]|uniref:FliO/MopB family protein n=1 Tax=Parafrigoribacterium soli TaxID=3144663 RepID=UPI0032ED7E61